MSPENGSKSDIENGFDPKNDSIVNFEEMEQFEIDEEIDQVIFLLCTCSSKLYSWHFINTRERFWISVKLTFLIMIFWFSA